MELTKDADHMICCIYKAFLQRRKNGLTKSQARRFDDNYFSTDDKLSSWSDGDISDSFLEIGRAKLIQIYIGGNFDLTDSAEIWTLAVCVVVCVTASVHIPFSKSKCNSEVFLPISTPFNLQIPFSVSRISVFNCVFLSTTLTLSLSGNLPFSVLQFLYQM